MRLNHRNALPRAVEAMAGLEDVVAESTLEPALLEPVKTRASQLNGCAEVGGDVSPLVGREMTR